MWVSGCGGVVCYSGDSVGSVAVYFCDDDYTLQGGSTRECLSIGLWNGTTPHCLETDGIYYEHLFNTYSLLRSWHRNSTQQLRMSIYRSDSWCCV